MSNELWQQGFLQNRGKSSFKQGYDTEDKLDIAYSQRT